MEAVSANQQRQPDRADELIKKARAINPEQQFLWSAAAYAAWLRGAMNEAIEDCRKELKLHPNEPGTYTLLADLQGRQGKRDDVEETLRLQLKVLGPNVDVSRELVQMLIEDERFTDAVTVAKTANTADPENARLRWLLGRALMQAGQWESGSALLIAALHSANDPGLLNDIADEFAESGQVTQEVEDAARKAVAQLTAETESWMLTSAGQDVRTMRARSSLLAASWDTLGWTIYVSASGKQPARLAEAEQYLNAAWRNGLNAIVGMHLGALQEALGRPAEALVSYQLARACSVYHMRNGMRELTPLQRDLDVRVARLKKEQPHAALKDPVAAYRDLEKLPAGSFHGQSLVVPYRLLIDASGVESLVAVDTVDGDQGKPDPDRDLPRLREAMKGAWVPSGSKAKLLRSAVLNCHQQTCEAMLTSIFDTR